MNADILCLPVRPEETWGGSMSFRRHAKRSKIGANSQWIDATAPRTAPTMPRSARRENGGAP
jgi:hypothetical protein